MFKRFVGFAFRLAVMALAGYHFVYKPWRRRWEVDPEEAARPLPGDDVVAHPQFRQTMALTVNAPPAAIWPWLVQMGYGRAGWYSYDAIDMLGHSSREIRPELQELQAGQPIPLAPNMNFRVEVVEPQRALVLFGDSELIKQQRAATEASGDSQEARGLKFVGLLSDANASAFQVSWAFVLDPLDAEHTRLIERFRTRSTPGRATVFVRPLIDVGHFLMTRKQMLGIKERAEMLARTTPALAAELVPAA